MVSSSSPGKINRFWIGVTALIGLISAVLLIMYLVLALNWRKDPFIGAMFTPLLVVDGSQSLGPKTWPGLDKGLQRMDRIVAINDDILYDPADPADSMNYNVVHDRYFAAMRKLAPGDEVTVQFERPDTTDAMPCAPGTLANCQISYALGELPIIDLIGFFIVPFISALGTWLVGAAVLLLRPRQPAARVISTLAFALAVLMGGLFDIDTTHQLIPFWLVANVLVAGSLVTFSLIFPVRSDLLYRWRGLILAPYVVCLLLVPLFLWFHANPPTPGFQVNIPPFLLVVVGIIALIASMLHHRRYATSAVVRDQSNTILIGIFLTSVPVVIWLINILSQTFYSTTAVPFNTSAATPFILIAPLSMAYAVLQYRFFDTDRIISQGITYFVMLVALVCGYALLVFSASLILTQTGISANNPLLVGVTIFVIALLFLPVRTFLQRQIDRLYFRQRYNFQEYVELFTHRIAHLRTMKQVVGEFRQILSDTVMPANTFIFVPDAQNATFVALGDPQPETDIHFPADSGIIHALEEQLIYLEPSREWPIEIRSERPRLQILDVLAIFGLRGSDQINGFVCVGPPQSGKGRYEHEELFFIQSLVSQMSIAVERAQVVDSLQRRVRELDVLSQVGQAVNFAINLDDLMELLSAQTNKLLDATYFYIALRDQVTDDVYFAFFLENDERYPEKENKPWPLGRDLFSEIILSGQPMRVTNYANAMSLRNAPQLHESRDIKAWMGVPLVAGTETMGVMAVGTTETGKQYGDDQFRIFSDISSLAAASIEKARLFAETNQRARQLAALNDVSNQLASQQQDVDKLLDLITNSAVEILNVEAGSLLLVPEDSSKELEFKIAVGSGSELVGKRFPVRSGLIGEVVRTSRYVIVNDATKDPRWAGEQTHNGFRTQSVLAVPLIANNQTIGVLEVLNKKGRGIFSEEDANLLTTFAGQAAVAIDNARLFQMTDLQLGERVAELEALERIDVELNRSLDIRTVAERTLRWAISQCGATAGALGIVTGGDHRVLEIVARYGYRDTEAPEGAEGSFWPLDKGIVSRVMRTRQADLAADVKIDPDWVSGQHHCLSQITVPMMSGGDINALLILEKNTEPRLSLVDMAFVQRLTEHASIALVNAQLYVDLARANDSKSEFVSFVAHELKTPMTSIKGYTDLLLNGIPGNVNEQQETFLGTIKANIERMNTLVSDLNDVTKLQTGNFHMEFTSVKFYHIVAETLRPLEHEIKDKEQQLEMQMPDSLPPIQADHNRLIQVLTNLLSNAHKYTPQGGKIHINAEVTDAPSGPKRSNTDPVLHITVRDTGIGMSDEDLAKLFTPYFRSDNPLAREQPGTGLGLTITRGIIEGHGGQIWVESTLGKGTTFHFTVPLAAEKQTTE